MVKLCLNLLDIPSWFDGDLEQVIELVKLAERRGVDQFEGLYQRPTPIQAGGVPVLFGFPATAANFARIAELGQGWLPMRVSQDKLAESTARLRLAFAARDRDPGTLEVRHVLMPSSGATRSAVLAATLAEAKGWVNAGVTIIEMYPQMFCERPEQFEGFLDGLLSLKRAS